jgi:hypothetical protein
MASSHIPSSSSMFRSGIDIRADDDCIRADPNMIILGRPARVFPPLAKECTLPKRAVLCMTTNQHVRLLNWVDAVEKGFSVPERRRIFHERLPVGNIDSGILHLGFYYCPSWMVHRSLVDFFNSIGHSRLRWPRPRLVHVRFNSDSDRQPSKRDPALRANGRHPRRSKFGAVKRANPSRKLRVGHCRRISTRPQTIKTAAAARAVRNGSLRTMTAIMAPNRTLVSRRLATMAMGASVIAQSTMP